MVINKRAQAAMEFLMTYGWAILVVMVVIGALAYFGVLTPTALLPEKCLLPVGFECEQHIVQEGEASFLVRNSMGKRVTVTSTKLVTPNGEEVCFSSGETAIENGRNAAIDLICGANADAGDKTKYILQLEYYQGDSADFTHTVKGDLITTIESGGSAGGTPLPPSIIESLSGYFTFEGDPASGIPDISGNGLDILPCEDHCPAVVPGKVGDGYLFDHDEITGDYMHMGNVLNMGLDDLTVSFWIKHDAPIQGFVISDAWSWPYYGVHINSNKARGMLVIDSEASSAATGTTLLNDGEWHHIVTVYDRDGDLKVYVNNVEEASADISSFNAIDITNTNALAIGANCNADCVNVGNFLRGTLDEIIFFQQALSASEVSDLYDSYQ